MSTTWQHKAACRDLTDPDELFFPTAAEGTALGDEARSFAVAICAGCPVREQCLRFALETRQDDGVFGGATEAQRRAMRGVSARPHIRTRPLPDPVDEPVPA
jgi:WhiB family redox-sensing transcriptional regulator